MADDQLSWEQLLKNAEVQKSESPAPASAAASEKSEFEEAKAAKKTTRSRKKPAAQSSGLADLYSKKDWSSLEKPKVMVDENTIAELQLKSRAQSAPPVPSTVKIPVIRSASELKYEPDAELESTENEPKVLSVSDLNKHIRQILEGRFPQIWLKAEISNFKAHTSGHFYFSLKDSKAQISAVMFRGQTQSLKFRPEDGMEVLVRGKITVYEPRGNYQMFCEMIEPVGAGALQKAYEQLKAKLQKEGLFDQARKRPLPAHPRHIAIVTSPTGAAIRDMLNVLGRRSRGVHITIIPCKVQGDAAPGEIVEAIKLAQKLKDIDVMIVGRGGGSIEDLWAFNDERVARAIAAVRVPVISAVGHEVDFTIADFVADLRAPTPSAAAELVVQNAAHLVTRLKQLSRSLTLNLAARLEASRDQLSYVSKRLIDPQRMLQDASIRSDELVQRLQYSFAQNLHKRQSRIELLRSRLGSPREKLERLHDLRLTLDLRLRAATQLLVRAKQDRVVKNMAVLDSLSPLKVLDRGFSMVMRGEQIISEANELKAGDAVTIRMCKGSVDATITKVKEDKR